MIHLNKYQASILSFLFKKLPIGDEVDTLEYSLPGDFSGKYKVAHATIEFAPNPAQLIFTLPTYSNNVFIAHARENYRDAARALNNLEDYERDKSIQLRLGEVVITNKEESTESTPYAVILLRTSTSVDCEKIPDTAEVDGVQTNFILVVPITRSEWLIRNELGHDALIDNFEETEKSIFFVN